MIDKEFLLAHAEGYELKIDDTVFNKLDRYAELLVEWNEKINLTAITKPEEIAIKHFLDSLLASKYMNVSHETSLIDVGTGAGFPGLPLKLFLPKLKLTLLDSLNKRLIFLSEVLGALEINADLVHARAEEGGRLAQHREKYDYATARAVAHLRELSEYCLPFVKVGGSFISLKGGNVEAEIDESNNAVAKLGGKIEAVHKLTLPGGDARSVIIIKKISHAPALYPRPSAKIAKNPLN